MYLCLQVVVVCLVILDAIFVLAEVLIDLSIIKLEHDHIAPQVRWHKVNISVQFWIQISRKCKCLCCSL